MSNKLYIALFTLFISLTPLTKAHSSINAYDSETGSVVELVDFEYGRYNFIIDQTIEYFDLESYKRGYATIDNIEDNFSSVILTITDNDTKITRQITVNIEENI